MNTRLSLKLDAASEAEDFRPSIISFSLRATRMPLPPPPAAALIIIGKPISAITFLACSGVVMMSSVPGTQDTPAAVAIFFDSILSPIFLTAFDEGPISATPASSRRRANSAFSERNP